MYVHDVALQRISNTSRSKLFSMLFSLIFAHNDDDDDNNVGGDGGPTALAPRFV